MIDKTQFLAYLMFLADMYGTGSIVFSCFSCEEKCEEHIPIDEGTYYLLDEARDGLPRNISHPMNNGFIYVNSVAERMGMDYVEWQMGDIENNDKIKLKLYLKYRHKVSREGLEELFKELDRSTEYEFKEFLVAKRLVK